MAVTMAVYDIVQSPTHLLRLFVRLTTIILVLDLTDHPPGDSTEMPGFVQIHTIHMSEYHLAKSWLASGECPPEYPRGSRPGEPPASPTAEAAKMACPKQALPKALSMGATRQPRKYSRVLASLCSVSAVLYLNHHCRKGTMQPLSSRLTD